MTTTKPESEELKACPFCGTKPTEVDRPFGQDYYISCDTCDGSVEVVATTRVEAIAAWNRRDDIRLRSLDRVVSMARIVIESRCNRNKRFDQEMVTMDSINALEESLYAFDKENGK